MKILTNISRNISFLFIVLFMTAVLLAGTDVRGQQQNQDQQQASGSGQEVRGWICPDWGDVYRSQKIDRSGVG